MYSRQSEVQLWFPYHHRHIHHILLSDKGGGRVRMTEVMVEFEYCYFFELLYFLFSESNRDNPHCPR